MLWKIVFFRVFSFDFKFRGVIGVDDWSTYLGFPAGTVGLFHPFTRMNPLPKRDEQEKNIYYRLFLSTSRKSQYFG